MASLDLFPPRFTCGLLDASVVRNWGFPYFQEGPSGFFELFYRHLMLCKVLLQVLSEATERRQESKHEEILELD